MPSVAVVTDVTDSCTEEPSIEEISSSTALISLNSSPKKKQRSQQATKNVRPLLNSAEVKKIEGKLRCLYKLLQHPRRHIEEIQDTIKRTLNFYQAALYCKDLPYNENDKAKMTEGLWKIQIREDILIRVIVGEQSVEDALQFHATKLLEHPLIYQ